MQYFVEGSDKSISLRLKWHTIAINFNPLFKIYLCILFIFASELTSLLLSQLPYQATQMTYILEGRLRGAVEEADKERALKEVSKSNLQELTAKLANVERRSVEAERACVVIEKRMVEFEGKLGKA